MEYKFTFQDGSEVIAHYGVQGMKWGKWNSETQARYANAGNGTYFKKAQRGSEYGKAVTDLRRKYNANQPKSKQIAKVVLLSVGGAHAYNTSRSRGLSRSDSIRNSAQGFLYAQGVKHKQKQLGTTTPMVSKAAKERGDSTKNESLKTTFIKNALLGDYGSITYESVKARTNSKGKAIVAGVLANLATGGSNSVNRENNSNKHLASGGIVSAILRRNGYDEQVKASPFNVRTPELKKSGKQRR